MFSCQKEAPAAIDPLDPSIPRAGMKVEFDLGIPESVSPQDATRAGAAYKPDTKFVAGDKIALLFFASDAATATVLTVREVVVETADVTANKVSEIISDIPTSMTHVKAIMNYSLADNATTQQAGTVFTIAQFQGKQLSEIDFILKERTGVAKPDAAPGALVNYSPHNIFASDIMLVSITAGQAPAATTVNFVMTRVVSLCRVIIKDVTENELVDAFDLTAVENVIMIRKNTSTIDLAGALGTAYAQISGSGIATLGASNQANTLTGYVGTAFTDMGAKKTWKDFIIYPQAAGAESKLNLLLGVKTKKEVNNPVGGTFPIGTVLYYSGEVTVAGDVAIGANKIVEITVAFDGMSGGSITPPLPQEYGDFTAVVSLAAWDDTVIDADTNM